MVVNFWHSVISSHLFFQLSTSEIPGHVQTPILETHNGRSLSVGCTIGHERMVPWSDVISESVLRMISMERGLYIWFNSLVVDSIFPQ